MGEPVDVNLGPGMYQFSDVPNASRWNTVVGGAANGGNSNNTRLHDATGSPFEHAQVGDLIQNVTEGVLVRITNVVDHNNVDTEPLPVGKQWDGDTYNYNVGIEAVREKWIFEIPFDRGGKLVIPIVDDSTRPLSSKEKSNSEIEVGRDANNENEEQKIYNRLSQRLGRNDFNVQKYTYTDDEQYHPDDKNAEELLDEESLIYNVTRGGHVRYEITFSESSPIPNLTYTQAIVFLGGSATEFNLNFDQETVTIKKAEATDPTDKDGIKQQLESLADIETVTVTGEGTPESPWIVNYANSTRTAMTAQQKLTAGDLSTDISTTRFDHVYSQPLYLPTPKSEFNLSFGAESPLSIVTANATDRTSTTGIVQKLKGLASVSEVYVTGAGTKSDPWLVTYMSSPGNPLQPSERINSTPDTVADPRRSQRRHRFDTSRRWTSGRPDEHDTNSLTITFSDDALGNMTLNAKSTTGYDATKQEIVTVAIADDLSSQQAAIQTAVQEALHVHLKAQPGNESIELDDITVQVVLNDSVTKSHLFNISFTNDVTVDTQTFTPQ